VNVTRFLLTCNGRRYSSDLSTQEFCLNKGEIAEDALHRTLAAFQTKECLHTADYAGGRKYYTYEMDCPDPCFDCPTELVAVSLNRNDGFVLKSWTGNCAYFDANGNYLGMLPATLPDDPDDWVTGDTIYVKCLKAQPYLHGFRHDRYGGAGGRDCGGGNSPGRVYCRKRAGPSAGRL